MVNPGQTLVDAIEDWVFASLEREIMSQPYVRHAIMAEHTRLRQLNDLETTLCTLVKSGKDVKEAPQKWLRAIREKERKLEGEEKQLKEAASKTDPSAMNLEGFAKRYSRLGVFTAECSRIVRESKDLLKDAGGKM